MKNKIDLEKIVNNTDNNKSPASVAFKIEDINFDLESIKEALKVSEKIFLQIGSFEYEGSQEELRFIFDGENIIDELEYIDEVYEKYKSHRDAGYGIYLDKDLNVEYGYYTEKYSNWEFHKIFHDFKNASEDDEVKLEICTLLANADIWITADISIDDFHNKCDLEKLAKLINWGNVSIFGASDGNGPVGLGNLDFDSFKEALNDYDKIFLELGDFSYSSDDSDILIDAHNDWLTSYDVISDIENEYYDKYKFEVGGYGIYLDKDLNVEYGYYVDRFNYTDFHDFENARDDDKVKNEIYSILDKLDIWNPCEVSSFPNDKMYCPNCGKRYNIVEEFCPNCRTKLITGTLVNEKLQAEQEIKNNHIKELSELDDSSDIKMHLDNASLSEYEITNYNFKINKIESELISTIKQKIGDNLFKRLCTEIDKSYYSSLCKKISDFFSLNYETDDEILKYLCNNFPANTVYLFIFLHEPDALSSNTFDKGLHEGGVLIKLMDGTILSSWYDVVDKSNVKYVIEDLSNETNLSGKYDSCTNLISAKLTGIRKDVTDMSRMFHDCSSLVDVSGLSEWDVSNVTDMRGMFAACRSLFSVSGLSEWDVSNVENMKDMFCACYSLEDISGLSEWDVSNVVNMKGMFSGCWHLDVSGLSEWDVSNVENMNEMFRACSYLVDISCLSEWDVSNVTNMKDMFVVCGSLVSVSCLSKWNVSNVTNMIGMFDSCKSLVDISSLSEWDMSNVENISGMFNSCESLVDISCLSEWDVSNVKNMVSMFYGCSSLVDVSGLSGWDVSNVENMAFMFYGCSSLVDVSGLSEWDVSNVEDMAYMFNRCSSLVDVSGLSEWDVSNVEDMKSMFKNCSSLVDVSGLSEWDVSNVTNMDSMFEGCKSLADDSLLKYWSEKID